MPTVYLETSVISYLAARPSGDLVTAAHQQVTDLWWRTRRRDFELFVSQLVLDECAAGDSEAADRRRGLLRDLPLLDMDPEVTDLACIARGYRPTILCTPEELAGGDADE